MGFLSLLEVASMPILQVLIISILGAFMATDYLNLLPADSRRYLNKIVFAAFTPSLVFASLAKTVSFQDIISWWFMPINIGITFLVGGTLGWIAVKILKPKPYLEGLLIAMCSSGNLGNILLIIIPAICKEDGNPFGDKNVCSTVGLSYVSLSMATGAFYIWTYTYHLIRKSGEKYKAILEVAAEDQESSSKEPNKDIESNETSSLLSIDASPPEENNINTSVQKQIIEKKQNETSLSQILRTLHQIGEELKSPPILAAILGFIFGAVTWLHNLIIGDGAPLRVIDDSIKLLGDGTIPCITLILGGNLTQGLRQARLKAMDIIAVLCIRYAILPVVGIFVVRGAAHLGFLPADPLYHFVLLIQFTLPPAMNIGTMTQLFGVAQEECSVLFLWTYLAAALALTGWSTVFMWLLS